MRFNMKKIFGMTAQQAKELELAAQTLKVSQALLLRAGVMLLLEKIDEGDADDIHDLLDYHEQEG